MDKTYNPQELEKKWYDIWEKGDYFAPKPNPNSQEGTLPYCIMIPPPNVTGRLHMGHGFQDTLMDTLIRYHRMMGEETLWQVGTDHAGISTQMVVERQLAEEQVSRHDLGREAFEKRIWKWKEEFGGIITQQLRRMGASVDWSRERFTLDEGMSEAVLDVFVRLYDEELIYRGKRLVNWDPHFRSAVSDLEVINNEEDGYLWHIRYPLADRDIGHDYLVVATTRPETMLGDVAVAVHPEDERYKELIGHQLQLPLTDRLIPIIADDYVDPEFGSGCVKITPAHDFNDYEVGQRHQLPQINIFTETAQLNENAPKDYQGMDRFDARKKVISDLEKLGLMEKIEPHKLSVPRADRGNTIIEPYLTNQWYVKAKPLAEPAIEAVKSDRIRFVPETWKKTYFQWMENIQDWCISRQLWWGHRIPAWYDHEGNIYVAHNEAAAREKYKLTDEIELRQEDDVLDTWFSSALWPFSTLGWPKETDSFKTFYPTHVLLTGFDIIFFWVARMIMMGLKFTGEVPFHEVYFTGLIRDSEGNKMSKSKGNVLDPINLIEGISLKTLIEKRTTGLMQPWMRERVIKNTKKEFPNGISAHGTDALRFTFCALATTGRDIRFDIKRLEGYRNFCNKLWNAARYVLMNVEGVELHKDLNSEKEKVNFSLADRWIQSRLQQTIRTVRQHLNEYRFDLTAQTLYEFIWHEFCDWYLELSKPVLTHPNASPKEQWGTRRTLVNVLETLLRLLHPLMPFITEEIWQQLKPYTYTRNPEKTDETIMLQPYPEVEPTYINKEIDEEIDWLKAVIIGVRNIRGEMNIAPRKRLPLLINKFSTLDKKRFEKNLQFFMTLARIESICFLSENQQPPASATSLVGKMELLIPIAGLIDIEAEKRRLNKEIEKLKKDLEGSKGKLANKNFVEKAPKQVVKQESERVTRMEASLKKLNEKLGAAQK